MSQLWYPEQPPIPSHTDQLSHEMAPYLITGQVTTDRTVSRIGLEPNCNRSLR